MVPFQKHTFVAVHPGGAAVMALSPAGAAVETYALALTESLAELAVAVPASPPTGRITPAAMAKNRLVALFN